MSNGLILLVVVLVFALSFYFKIYKKTNGLTYNSNGIPIGMEDKFEAVINPGADGKPVLYDLTTCKNCVKVHDFLLENGIEHHDVALDLFKGQAKKDAVEKLKSYNERLSFPTLVFPDGQVVIGYRVEELRKAIGLKD